MSGKAKLMNEDDKKRIRLEIEKKIKELKKSIISLEEQSKPVEPDRAIGRITRMDAIQQKSVCEANLRAAEESLYQLEETLPLIDQPGFGICAACGQNIPVERVLLVPASRLCVSCAAKR